MKDIALLFFFCFCLVLVSLLREANAVSQEKNDGVYIVYMGAADSNHQAELMSSLIRRKKDAVVHSYSNGFSGFAARLSEAEAKAIAQRPGVVSVFPDPILQLHTTRSWDFLQYQTDVVINAGSISGSDNSSAKGADTIIGILDTGIWPESESFNDNDMSEVPSRWKGTCMESHDSSSFKCNKKLVGARFYDGSGDRSIRPFSTARDQNGHGTHVASTAAGNPISGASYYGLASGTAKGGSPGSRIAMYRVCMSDGCRGSAIMKAFDDAIADGVDVLSLSLGSSSGLEPAFSSDPIAIGAFHAVEKGILVACSAGNDGPDAGSVVNVAPWILTVAATTIDRDFETDIVLGGNKSIKGGGISFSNLTNSPVYPLISGDLAKSGDDDLSEKNARSCNPDSLDGKKVKGKIVLCDNHDGEYSLSMKVEEVRSKGGIGFIVVDDNARTVAPKFKSFPAAVVTEKDSNEILSYINSTKNPVASVLPTVSITKYKPAPVVAYFSSRGPAYNTHNLLKPDITAPGVAILAAWPANDTREAVAGQEPPLFNIISGTSMSCPHVSGIAAIVKAQNPSWSPSAIKSAIMTTAIQTNNLKAPITTVSGSVATPYDIGAGEASPSAALNPGLVYETNTADYLEFLCSVGYNKSKIKLISNTVPDDFSCPTDSSSESVSQMNYPSIAVSNTKENEITKVTRTVTNVGQEDATYTASIKAPAGLEVQVIPIKLVFTNNSKKLSYEVSFKASSKPKEDLFGSITWTNGKYKVQSPFVVTTNLESV
ncbi:CO(2)-response secreted protease [Capsicum annuum]|uniref:CO(2)-response secreted protease n=1 Tax=Capsicum annuum TaxID=4072 RepID=A0A1U8GAI0_CAPAN|nr:CO(2)-response secreted protease [Capsicum annuum]KAF3628962.1 CO(2)-response secreted protease [Capsicum annuum]KAF3661433.1 CO(2)-response secreted protease [Capsicum annuum]PHT84978.1 CO(2)-response secreted protease [Capsicum annuum]